ncbi:hypothetical protein GCM10029978_110210 [Actinoallomurus acanthiterrae]
MLLSSHEAHGPSQSVGGRGRPEPRFARETAARDRPASTVPGRHRAERSAAGPSRRDRRLGAEEEFTVYLAGLRTAQKRKRNLMRILDQQDL